MHFSEADRRLYVCSDRSSGRRPVCEVPPLGTELPPAHSGASTTRHLAAETGSGSTTADRRISSADRATASAQLGIHVGHLVVIDAQLFMEFSNITWAFRMCLPYHIFWNQKPTRIIISFQVYSEMTSDNHRMSRAYAIKVLSLSPSYPIL